MAAVGGVGLDVDVNVEVTRSFAIRQTQVDYLTYRTLKAWHTGVRVSAGVVFNLDRRS